MTAVETLRSAAQLMRSRAKAAKHGPRWEYVGGNDGDGLVWGVEQRMDDPVAGSSHPECAAHIAGADPAVMLAVADWLDEVIADLTLRCGTYTYLDAGNIPAPALAVARTYLRGGE